MKATFNFKEVAPILFAVMVDILGFSVAFPILTSLFMEGDFLPKATPHALRYTYLSISFALYPLFMFFGSSFMGDLSDRLGRKKILLFCMSGFTVGFIMMGMAVTSKDLSMVLLGRIITGFTAASLPVTLAAIVDLSTKSNKAFHMSLVVLVQSVGLVIGPLMSGVLTNSDIVVFFNESTPFFVSAVISAVTVFWIWMGFQETFVCKAQKKINPARIILNFIEAAKHRKVRILVLAFICQQVGIGLYIQLVLIYLQNTFNYSTSTLGLFNAFLGIWFAIGLMVVIPYAAKRFDIEKIAYICLLLMGLSQVATSVFPLQILIWLIAIPYATFANSAWSSMLTSCSQAVDQKSQGWVLGLTGAIVALAFMVTGFTPMLVPQLGAMPLIAFGGVLVLFSSSVMRYYCRHVVKGQDRS